MAGKESWDSPKVKAVFNHWRELLPYYSSGALGLTWQEGAQQLINKQAGMYLLGSFVGQQSTNAADHADLDFFAVPGDQPDARPGLDRRADRRLPDVEEGEEQGRREAAARVPRQRRRREHLPATDPNDVAANKHAEHARTTTRCRRRRPTLIAQREAHRAVHGPRHAAGLRVDGDDPGAAAVPQQPERRERARLEHPEAEEVDLRLVRLYVAVDVSTPRVATDGARAAKARAVRLLDSATGSRSR